MFLWQVYKLHCICQMQCNLKMYYSFSLTQQVWWWQHHLLVSTLTNVNQTEVEIQQWFITEMIIINMECILFFKSNKEPGCAIYVGFISAPPQTWEDMKKSSTVDKNPWYALTPKKIDSVWQNIPMVLDFLYMYRNVWSVNSGKEYYHLERTRKAHAYIPPPALKNESVNEMVGKGLIITSRQEECMALFQHANTEVVDSAFPIFWG